jgi:glycosyltransferase involved in cell wall biosynthesis
VFAPLAIAIPTRNRAAMLDGILRDLLPAATALGVRVFVSDNGSEDETPAVCARYGAQFPEARFQRHAATLPIGESVMSAMTMSNVEYTWLRGDDDYLVPGALDAVLEVVSARRPSAVVTGTAEVSAETVVDYAKPIWPQIEARVEERSAVREYDDAAALFGTKFYDLPIPSVVFRTKETLATSYARYFPTHHPHTGAMFDALAVEQEARGRVDVVELTRVCSVSLTSIAVRPRGKENWAALFHDLAHHGFPLWFDLMHAIYRPHIPAALAYHRHIFRAAFASEAGDAGAKR